MMKGSTGLSKGLMDRIDRLSSNARQHVRRRLLSTPGERERSCHSPPHPPRAPGSTPPTQVADSTTCGHPGPSRRYVPDRLGRHHHRPRRGAQPPPRGRWVGLLVRHDPALARPLCHRLLLDALPDGSLPGARGRAQVCQGESQAEQGRCAERQLRGYPADECIPNECMKPRTAFCSRARTQLMDKPAPRRALRS